MAKAGKTPKKETWRTWKVPYRDGSVDWAGPQKEDTHWIAGWIHSNGVTKKVDGDLIDWQPNEPFNAALKFIEMFHGANGSTHALVENTDTLGTYIMRNADLERCLREGVLVHGVILGEWRFMKASNRYSVVPVEFFSTFAKEI